MINVWREREREKQAEFIFRFKRRFQLNKKKLRSHFLKKASLARSENQFNVETKKLIEREKPKNKSFGSIQETKVFLQIILRNFELKPIFAN